MQSVVLLKSARDELDRPMSFHRCCLIKVGSSLQRYGLPLFKTVCICLMLCQVIGACGPASRASQKLISCMWILTSADRMLPRATRNASSSNQWAPSCDSFPSCTAGITDGFCCTVSKAKGVVRPACTLSLLCIVYKPKHV